MFCILRFLSLLDDVIGFKQTTSDGAVTKGENYTVWDLSSKGLGHLPRVSIWWVEKKIIYS